MSNPEAEKWDFLNVLGQPDGPTDEQLEELADPAITDKMRAELGFIDAQRITSNERWHEILAIHAKPDRTIDIRNVPVGEEIVAMAVILARTGNIDV